MLQMPFSHTDYKAFIQERIEQSKEWGIVSRLAKAAGCQRSYLSKALNSHTHLVPEHVYGIAKFFKLNSDETDFLLLLLEKDRAGTKDYQDRIKAKIHHLLKQYENLAHKLKKPEIVFQEEEQIYYTAWYWSAAHIAVSIERFQKIEDLSTYLQMPIAQLKLILETLRKFGFVEEKNNRWSCTPREIYVPKVSPLTMVHHNNWRQRAVLDAGNPFTEGVHYTMVQSMDANAVSQIKKMILDLIENSAEVAGPSRPEELICINCDFFKV
jgi:uncharacterized protein (TIGR02147 family)